MARHALSKAEASYITKLIRVDQAGELGADLIYRGQYMVLSRTKPEIEPLIKHMWEQEQHHRRTFNELQQKYRVRPSLFTPIWKVAATGLGCATGLLGQEGAMACTEAVETVIGGHYNTQLRWLHENFPPKEERSKDEEITSLKSIVKQFRDEELEHLEIAVENDSHEARPYWLLTETIKAGCRGAIWVAERA